VEEIDVTGPPLSKAKVVLDCI